MIYFETIFTICSTYTTCPLSPSAIVYTLAVSSWSSESSIFISFSNRDLVFLIVSRPFEPVLIHHLSAFLQYVNLILYHFSWVCSKPYYDKAVIEESMIRHIQPWHAFVSLWKLITYVYPLLLRTTIAHVRI